MEKNKILICEDESILALELEGRLTKMGYYVVGSVDSGEESIKSAEKSKPDLVLMDIHLAGKMDGIEAAGEIRSRFDIPVLYLTAYSDNETLLRARITEPFGYLLKPYQERELHAAIEMALYKHKMEMKLKEREQRLAVTLKSIGDAIISTDEKGAVTFMNPQAEKMTGWTFKAAFGMDITDIFNIKINDSSSPKNISEMKSFNDAIVFGLKDDVLLISKDGREAPIVYNISPITDDRGNVSGGVLVIHDLSERQKIEEKLLMLEKAFETMQIGVTITNKEGIILYTNSAEARMHGFPMEAMIGKDVRTFAPYELSKPMNLEQLEELRSWKRESINLRKDGATFPVQLMSDLVINSSDDVIGIVTSCEDISERKRMEKELQQYSRHLNDLVTERTGQLTKTNDQLRHEIAERKETEKKLEQLLDELKNSQDQLIQSEKMASLGQLVAGIAHEINNPLGFLKSNMNNLQKFIKKIVAFINTCEQSDLSEEARERINKKKEEIQYDYLMQRLNKIIESSGIGIERMKKIVLDLKTFSRLDASELIDTDINRSIDLTLDLLVHEYKDRIKIIKEYGNLPEVQCYSAKLNQVLMNLLINACQAIEGEGEIRIKTETEDETVLIQIGDTGKGIPKHHISKIFDPFFTTKPVGEGTGLGLSISHKIIKQHGGSITVDSEIDRGTTFSITIPRKV